MKQGPAWISGPDPVHHEMYVAYGYKRQTSLRRGESWSLTWPCYRDLWQDHWHQRGTAADSLCLVRKDFDGVWQDHNVELITRREHSQRIREYYK